MNKERWSGLYKKWSGPVYGLIALVIVLAVLFAGEDVGLSNNGDFSRALNASSLTFGEEEPRYRYEDTYTIVLEHDSAAANVADILFSTQGLRHYPSVHVLLIRASVVANLVVNKLAGWEMTTYHLSVLGVMQALLYSVGIGLLFAQFRLKRLWMDVLVKLAALLVLCDIGYVAYFNSFYGEALEHIALVFCAAMLLRVLTRTPTLWDGIWCGVSALVYGWAKFFNVPLACLFVVVTAGIILVRTRRKRAVVCGGAALAILLGVMVIMPGWMGVETNYNAVFYGVIRDVDEDTARQYLRDMGMSEELADYRDTNYYLGGVLESLAERGLLEEAESISRMDLIKFYLTHPGRLWRQAELTAMHCGMVRPYYLANHGGDAPLMTYSARMSLWSAVRDRMPLDTLWGNFGVIALFCACVVVLLRKKVRWQWIALPLAALLGALAYSFMLPVMLNGEGDFAKHMFAFVELMDLLLLAALALILNGLARGGAYRRLHAAAGVLLAALLLLPPVWETAAGAVRAARSHPGLEQGAYVTLGSYQGRALLWQVVEAGDGAYTLMEAEGRIVAAFDQDGENGWADSSSRAWLNGAFLESFSREEQELLAEQENSVLLPEWLREQADGGYLDFACSHIAVLADRGYDRAHQRTVTDLVTLPDIDLAAALARSGEGIAGSYWLEAPYCPSANLVRYVERDGHIYFGAAETGRELRPVICISQAGISSGSGSRRDPFVLE